MFYNDKVRNSSGEPNNSKWNLANNKAYEYMRQELVEIDEKNRQVHNNRRFWHYSLSSW